MNHTDKLVLLPVERYELLKRLSRPVEPEKMSTEKHSELEEEEEGEEVAKNEEKALGGPAEASIGVSPKEMENVLLSRVDIIKSMKTVDRRYASKILRRMDSSLWDSNGVLIGLGLQVRDLIHDLKNSTEDKLITPTRRRNIRHFIYKHTSISPSMISNPKYARINVAGKSKKDSVKVLKKQWLNQQ